MRKLLLAILIMVILVIGGVFTVVRHVWQNGHGISISVNEREDVYQLQARYAAYRSAYVQRYLAQRLHNNLFRSRNVRADIILEDHTHLFIKTYPGHLQIRFNKRENDVEAYMRMKELTQDLKRRLTEPGYY
jgi:hypothetical protein